MNKRQEPKGLREWLKTHGIPVADSTEMCSYFMPHSSGTWGCREPNIQCNDCVLTWDNPTRSIDLARIKAEVMAEAATKPLYDLTKVGPVMWPEPVMVEVSADKKCWKGPFVYAGKDPAYSSHFWYWDSEHLRTAHHIRHPAPKSSTKTVLLTHWEIFGLGDVVFSHISSKYAFVGWHSQLCTQEHEWMPRGEYVAGGDNWRPLTKQAIEASS